MNMFLWVSLAYFIFMLLISHGYYSVFHLFWVIQFLSTYWVSLLVISIIIWKPYVHDDSVFGYWRHLIFCMYQSLIISLPNSCPILLFIPNLENDCFTMKKMKLMLHMIMLIRWLLMINEHWNKQPIFF